MTSANRKVGVDYQALVPSPQQLHVVLRDVPKRLIVVGDVHGCLEELQNLLAACDFNEDNGDQVLLVGDLVNKGPLSAETVRFVRESNFHCIRGNHDDFVLCHALKLVDSERPPSLNYIDDLSKDDIDWMANLPYSISIPAWRTVCVHAGLVPSQSLQSQTAGNLVTMRNVIDESSGMVATSKPDLGSPWISLWDGNLIGVTELCGNEQDYYANSRWHVIFGHDAKRGLQETPFATGLDTGCAYGKKLTGLILPERRIVQVSAKEAYSPINEKE